MRWIEPEIGDLFINVIQSINVQAQAIYGTDLVLASYSDIHGTLRTLDDIGIQLELVSRETEKLSGHPRAYLSAIIGGLKMIIRVMQGDKVPYAEQIEAMQEVTPKDIPQEGIESLREKIDLQLTNRGYKGSFGEKVSAYLNKTLIPAEEVTSVAEKFLSRCKASTEKYVLTLPEGDGIESVNGKRGVFWSGNSAYVGNFQGTLTFNLDRPWSMPTFGNILCHEGYPGHHAFYSHWDELYQQGKLPLEAAYYVKNTPTNGLFEGSPETALHFLGWDNLEEETPEVTDAEKQDFALGRDILDLQRMYQTQACFSVNMAGMDKSEAVTYMMKSGLFEKVEAENSYRFFTDATRRTYYPSYYYGRWMIFEAYSLFPEERKGEFYKIIYDNPHTTRTFIDEIRKVIDQSFDPFVIH